MLVETTSSSVPMTKGVFSASSTRWAISAASSSPAIDSAITVNSSPPSRDTVKPSSSPARVTVSLRRRQPDSTCATCWRSRSPVSWPRLSLTALKRSMSNSIRAIARPVWRERAIARPSRSRNRARFGRPVRLSYWARCWSWSSARRRSPRSRMRTRYCCGRLPGSLEMPSSTGAREPSGRRICASPSRNAAGVADPAGGATRSCSRWPASAEGGSPSSRAAAGLQLAISPWAPHSTSPSDERSKTRPSSRRRSSRSARTRSSSARDATGHRAAAQPGGRCSAPSAGAEGGALMGSDGSDMTGDERVSAPLAAP